MGAEGDRRDMELQVFSYTEFPYDIAERFWPPRFPVRTYLYVGVKK